MARFGRNAIRNALEFIFRPLIPIERVTSGVASVDTNHAQVHFGNAYHFSEKLSLAAGSSRDLTIDVPEGSYVHLQNIAAILSREFSVDIIEGDTPATGSEVTPKNRHRIKDYTSALTLHDTAVSANTTTLVSKSRPASNQGGTGVVEDGIEWVLSGGKSYTITVANTDSQAGIGFLKVDWYEEASA